MSKRWHGRLMLGKTYLRHCTRTRWVTEQIAHARRRDPTRELKEQDRMQPTENRPYTARKETNKVLGRRRFISRQGTRMGDPFT